MILVQAEGGWKYAMASFLAIYTFTVEMTPGSKQSGAESRMQSRPNHAFDRTPESIAALRGWSLGGAGQGER